MTLEYVDIKFGKRYFKVPKKVTGNDRRSYLVEEQIGSGGNAVVCQCVDERDGESFAIKFLTHWEPKRLKRFAIETELIQKLTASQHGHLIRFVTSGAVMCFSKVYGTKNDKQFELPFFVMELARTNLREFLKSEKAPVAQEIYNAQFRGLVDALEMLHQHAIHRDIKPENILIVGDRWAISDFGLCELVEGEEQADLTRIGEIPGPRFWLSPEANNLSVGAHEVICSASDIFQLAAVFWWVVTRRHPSGILTRDDWTGADKLYIPVSTALQHSLTRRYAKASEFKTAVLLAIDETG